MLQSTHLRLARLVSAFALGFALAASSAHAQIAIEFVTVGAPGAPGYPELANPSASVPYAFEISRYEVTNEQYAAFLGAVAANDPNGLWFSSMQSNALGGIERTGTAGNWQYAVKPGMADKPVNYVSFWDALRFANWLHNGQPAGDQDATTTEDGAYTITPQGIAANDVPRNPGALYAVPTRDEWLKAGYSEDAPSTWYLSPAQSQLLLVSGTPLDDDGNTGHCNSASSVLYDVGSYTLSESPWGTFDQGGNVSEWTEEIRGGGSARAHLGGSFASSCNATSPGGVPFFVPGQTISNLGFRVVRPSAPTVPLLGRFAMGILALAMTGVANHRFRVASR
ncbi:MAG: SUMF1/EgtB/PvdO family nonheme iron enzyme [Myxococcota bacterium]